MVLNSGRRNKVSVRLLQLIIRDRHEVYRRTVYAWILFSARGNEHELS